MQSADVKHAAASSSNEVPIIQVESLAKAYRTGRGVVNLFQGLCLQVHTGELLAVVGESGAGKSSLLHLLAAMDRPSAGSVIVDGVNLAGLNTRAQADFRNRTVGYVWQFHYLLPEFTALENVAMPLLARGVRRHTALRKAEYWLSQIELGHRAMHRSGELSGGEQQRVSLARALVTEPRVLLADEPTGDLDSRTAEVVFGLLESLHRLHRLTSILVTHHLGFAGRCDRMLVLRDGVLQSPEGI